MNVLRRNRRSIAVLAYGSKKFNSSNIFTLAYANRLMNNNASIQKNTLSVYGFGCIYAEEALLLQDAAADILRQLQYKELLLQLVQALKTLPDTCRETCWLYYEEGLTEKQIANHLNISPSTVHNRLTWGLHLLKTQFAKKPKNPV